MRAQKLEDSRGRKWRFAPPVSDGKSLVPTEADFAIFQFLDDHGPLPTPYLFEAASHLRRDYKDHQQRLGLLYRRDKTPHGGRYIDRPKIQENSYGALEHALVHDNSPIARQALYNRSVRLFPTRIDHMHHRFMNACCTASMRIACKGTGLEFVTLRQILEHDACPKPTRNAENPLEVPLGRGKLIPDFINGLAYPTEPKRTFRFLAWEQDRATETLGAIELKYQGYLEVLRNKLYGSHFGIPNLYVLTVTTRLERMHNMMDLLERMTKKEPHMREFFLFKFRPEFADVWIVPPVMPDMLTNPWLRAALPPLDLSKA